MDNGSFVCGLTVHVLRFANRNGHVVEKSQFSRSQLKDFRRGTVSHVDAHDKEGSSFQLALGRLEKLDTGVDRVPFRLRTDFQLREAR